MVEYIEREAAIHATRSLSAQDRIRNIPAADVVLVVRCKNCKHWKKQDFQTGNGTEHLEYGGWCPNARFARYESDFCSYGERRKGEDG